MILPEVSSNDSHTREPIFIAAVVLLLCLSTLMVGLRVTSRILIKEFGLDDYAAVGALMCIIGSGVAMISMTQYGLGRHESTLSFETLVLYKRAFWVSITFYMMSLFWIKLTFLLNYYRLLSVSNMRIVFLAAIVMLTLWAVSQAIMGFVQCVPLQAVWDTRIKGRCIPNRTTWWYFNGIFNIVTDFAILLLPLPIVWKLLLPLSQKIILMGIFTLGFFTIAVSILRLQWLKPQPDETWWNVVAASWSLAELTSAITCACIPTFRPLISKVPRLFTRSSKGDSTIRLQSSGMGTDVESNATTVVEMQDRLSQDTKRFSRAHAYGVQSSITAMRGT